MHYLYSSSLISQRLLLCIALAILQITIPSLKYMKTRIKFSAISSQVEKVFWDWLRLFWDFHCWADDSWNWNGPTDFSFCPPWPFQKLPSALSTKNWEKGEAWMCKTSSIHFQFAFWQKLQTFCILPESLSVCCVINRWNKALTLFLSPSLVLKMHKHH